MAPASAAGQSALGHVLRRMNLKISLNSLLGSLPPASCLPRSQSDNGHETHTYVMTSLDGGSGTGWTMVPSLILHHDDIEDGRKGVPSNKEFGDGA